MRRRDVAFVCLAWGALLAGLAWAFTTQFRWVREAKPVKMPQPLPTEEGLAPKPIESGPAVIGTIDDDTRAAMAKGLAPRPSRRTKRECGSERSKGRQP